METISSRVNDCFTSKEWKLYNCVFSQDSGSTEVLLLHCLCVSEVSISYFLSTVLSIVRQSTQCVNLLDSHMVIASSLLLPLIDSSGLKQHWSTVRVFYSSKSLPLWNLNQYLLPSTKKGKIRELWFHNPNTELILLQLYFQGMKKFTCPIAMRNEYRSAGRVDIRKSVMHFSISTIYFEWI